MEEFRPKWCPHVVGRFDREVDPDTGLPETTTVLIECERCGDRHRATCSSGAPTQWVLKFATGHLHRDPLADPFPKQEKKKP